MTKITQVAAEVEVCLSAQTPVLPVTAGLETARATLEVEEVAVCWCAWAPPAPAADKFESAKVTVVGEDSSARSPPAWVAGKFEMARPFPGESAVEVPHSLLAPAVQTVPEADRRHFPQTPAVLAGLEAEVIPVVAEVGMPTLPLKSVSLSFVDTPNYQLALVILTVGQAETQPDYPQALTGQAVVKAPRMPAPWQYKH